jgi:hypothetical protein
MKLIELSKVTNRLNEVDFYPIPRAVLCLALLLIPIVLINEQIVSSLYLNIVIMYTSIIVLGFIIGGQQLLNYFKKVDHSWGKTLKLAIFMYIANMLLTLLGILFVGSNPQGIAGKEDNILQFVKNISLLPFIGLGEEMFRLLAFLGFFSLLLGNLYIRFIIASLLTSAIFGLMHTFDYPFTAFLPLFLGAIPVIVLTIYYKSIVPAIIQHMILDGLSFLAHLEQIGESLAGLIIILAVIIWFFRRKIFKSNEAP